MAWAGIMIQNYTSDVISSSSHSPAVWLERHMAFLTSLSGNKGQQAKLLQNLEEIPNRWFKAPNCWKTGKSSCQNLGPWFSNVRKASSCPLCWGAVVLTIQFSYFSQVLSFCIIQDAACRKQLTEEEMDSWWGSACGEVQSLTGKYYRQNRDRKNLDRSVLYVAFI